MTTLFIDGFDHYDAGGHGGGNGCVNMLDGPWGEVPSTADATGISGPLIPPWGPRTGTFAAGYIGGGGGGCYRRALPATKTALVVAMGYSFASLPTSAGEVNVCGFRDGGNNIFAELWVTTTGGLELRNPGLAAAGSTILVATNGPVLTTQNWHFLEMEIDIAGGTFVLRVDDTTGAGTPVINGGGLTFGHLTNGTVVATTPMAQVAFLVQYSREPIASYFDDLRVTDTSGAVNNGFVGDTRIATSFPQADTATAGWTPRYRKLMGTGVLDNRAVNLATGAGAMVTLGTTAGTDLGSADFTIEQFVRFSALPTLANKSVIFGKWDESGNQRSYQLYLSGPSLDSGNLIFRTSTNGAAGTVVEKVSYPWMPDLNVWYHVAIVKHTNQVFFYVNGVQLGLPIADTDTYFAGAALTVLGGQDDTAGPVVGTSLNGFFDEVRLTPGVARYLAPFAPPAAPFPRNVGGDPNFASVQWLSGFDSGIFDESSFARALASVNGSLQNTPDDGSAIGVFSTINKPAPADDTFVTAPLTPATSILTLTALPAANDTVTVGTKSGPAAAVYKFVAAVASAYDVKLGVDVPTTLLNLFNAINAGPGAGTTYGTGTLSNIDVNATQLPGNQMEVIANVLGTAGNAIASTVSLTHGGGWTGATLAGGLAIPGPSEWLMQRPPPLTTVITAVELVFRGFKSDAGTASVKSSFVGPLGGHTDGGVHAMTVSPVYYGDIFETDPDTAAAITPTTLVNGRIRLTRTA